MTGLLGDKLLIEVASPVILLLNMWALPFIVSLAHADSSERCRPAASSLFIPPASLSLLLSFFLSFFLFFPLTRPPHTLSVALASMYHTIRQAEGERTDCLSSSLPPPPHPLKVEMECFQEADSCHLTNKCVSFPFPCLFFIIYFS